MSNATPVTILNEWPRIPVFHLHHPDGSRSTRLERDDGAAEVTQRWVTACGQVITSWGWTHHPDEPDWEKRHTDQWDGGRRGFSLRRDHAESFARLCQRCAAHG